MRQFRWADQTPVDYTKWAPTEPNNVHGNEYCVELYVGAPDEHSQTMLGKWNDAGCDFVPYKAICQKPAKN